MIIGVIKNKNTNIFLRNSEVRWYSKALKCTFHSDKIRLERMATKKNRSRRGNKYQRIPCLCCVLSLLESLQNFPIKPKQRKINQDDLIDEYEVLLGRNESTKGCEGNVSCHD